MSRFGFVQWEVHFQVIRFNLEKRFVLYTGILERLKGVPSDGKYSVLKRGGVLADNIRYPNIVMYNNNDLEYRTSDNFDTFL